MVVVDIEGYGLDEFINIIHNKADSFLIKVISEDSVSNDDEWTDDNPLNKINCTRNEALEEFNRIKTS